VRAYHEEQDYQRAIEKFGDAIENETQHMEGNVTDSNSIVAKAMYWQAEAYVKLQDIPQAIVVFESLIQSYQEHYLSLAAQRRTAQLSPEDS
jgi:TolA-binding protein